MKDDNDPVVVQKSSTYHFIVNICSLGRYKMELMSQIEILNWSSLVCLVDKELVDARVESREIFFSFFLLWENFYL